MIRLHDRRINQASGLAMSVRWPNIAYVCNDDPGPIFAVDVHTGRTVGSFRIGDIDETEALYVDEFGDLYIASIGDKNGTRHDCAIYVLPEPGPSDHGILPAQRIPVVYPDGPHNAEAIIVDPITHDVGIFTKERRGRLYRLSIADHKVRLVATRLPKFITDATYSASGRFVWLRLKHKRRIVVLDARNWQRVGTIRAPQMRQPESITVTDQGVRALVGSEGPNSPLIPVPMPPEVR